MNPADGSSFYPRRSFVRPLDPTELAAVMHRLGTALVVEAPVEPVPFEFVSFCRECYSIVDDLGRCDCPESLCHHEISFGRIGERNCHLEAHRCILGAGHTDRHRAITGPGTRTTEWTTG